MQRYKIFFSYASVFSFYSFKSLKLKHPTIFSGGVSSWLFHIILVKEYGFLSNFEDGAIADFIEGIIRHVRDFIDS